MILAMMRSTLMQHLDIVPELRGVGCGDVKDYAAYPALLAVRAPCP
jgi:hypothetical protein